MPDTVDPAARDKYLLEVTAGPSYSSSTHQRIPVNSPTATRIDSSLFTAYLHVRIKDYHGLPLNSPPTSSYFSHPQHTSDRYSVAYSFIPKTDIPGADLVMGFDYDHSIRHQLPPGFKYAMKIATSLLDPGLYSDAYADEPYLYGPALSSWFAFRIGEKVEDVSVEDQLARLQSESGDVIDEGADGSGKAVRNEAGMPDKWKKRRKHFLNTQALKNFIFEKGRMYHADFFNPHLDFANFSLRLPGFSISVARYVDEKTHHLRYVLKNRRTGEVLITVFFKLLFGKELQETLAQEQICEDGGSEAVTTEGSKADGEEPGKTETTRSTETKPTSPQPGTVIEGPKSEIDGEGEDRGVVGVATSTASNLVNSIYGFYSALGFTNPSSSSSDSDATSRGSSRQTSRRSIDAHVDDMDDATVEHYLQAQHKSSK